MSELPARQPLSEVIATQNNSCYPDIPGSKVPSPSVRSRILRGFTGKTILAAVTTGTLLFAHEDVAPTEDPSAVIPVSYESTSYDPCISRYPSGEQTTVDIFGGQRTMFDRQASLYQVCEGFGAPEDLDLSPSMQCALIAAAATFGGPVVNAGVSRGCDVGSVAADLASGEYLNAAAGQACNYFGEAFAEGVGIQYETRFGYIKWGATDC